MCAEKRIYWNVVVHYSHLDFFICSTVCIFVSPSWPVLARTSLPSAIPPGHFTACFFSAWTELLSARTHPLSICHMFASVVSPSYICQPSVLPGRYVFFSGNSSFRLQSSVGKVLVAAKCKAKFAFLRRWKLCKWKFSINENSFPKQNYM